MCEVKIKHKKMHFKNIKSQIIQKKVYLFFYLLNGLRKYDYIYYTLVYIIKENMRHFFESPTILKIYKKILRM
jgi:hypothetical protein